MVARHALGVLRCGALLAATLVLVGCPIPLPARYESSSRENLPAQPLDWVTVGVTTREDVLLRLGEADGEAPDGSWLAYGSVYSKGGVLFVLFAGGGAAGAGSERRRVSPPDHLHRRPRRRLGNRHRLSRLLGIHGRHGLERRAEPAVPEGRLPRMTSVSETWRQRRLGPCSPDPRPMEDGFRVRQLPWRNVTPMRRRDVRVSEILSTSVMPPSLDDLRVPELLPRTVWRQGADSELPRVGLAACPRATSCGTRGTA